MKIVAADFNAMTVSENVRLTLPCSIADIDRLELRPGDWAWLSDGEVIVGARLIVDGQDGLVGVPDWDTIIHLDDPGAEDYVRVGEDMKQLMAKEPRSEEEEARLLELMAQWEHFAPPEIQVDTPGRFCLRRARALLSMGKAELAWAEVKEAMKALPDDPEAADLYRTLAPRQAVKADVRESLRRLGTSG